MEAKNLVKAAEKYDYYEVRKIRTEGFSLLLRNGKIDGADLELTQGVGIRFLYKNNLYFSATNTIEGKEVDNLVLQTKKYASSRPVKIGFSKEKIEKAKYFMKAKKAPDEVDEKDKKEIANEIDGIFQDAGIKNRIVHIFDEVKHQTFENSDGTRIEVEIPRVGVFYFFTVNGRYLLQRAQTVATSGGYEFFSPKKLEEIRNEVKELKYVAENAKRISKEKTNVLLSSELTGIAVHESVGHPFEADRIIGRESAQGGESYVTPEASKAGKLRIGNSLVEVIDDPTIKEYGFFPYDDEGVKTRKKVLVKEGVLNELLHNRETAFEFNIKSNGSSRASSYNVEPIIRMSNTYLAPKDYKFDELLEEAKNGVYIKTFMEWNIDDTRVNERYIGGIAYEIKNSAIGEPVIFPTLETTTFEFWSKVKAVGKDLSFNAATCGKGEPMQGVPVTTGGPSIVLEKMVIWSR